MKTPLKLDDKRHQPATGLHCGPRPASQTALLHSGGFASNRTIKHFGDFISRHLTTSTIRRERLLNGDHLVGSSA